MTIDHAFLKRANGDPLKLLRETQIACPVCQHGRLCVLSETKVSQQLHCGHCDYMMARHRADDDEGAPRRMNEP